MTEPSSYHSNQGEAGPSRRRGTSLSITYGDDGTDGDNDSPWYLKLELGDRKGTSDEDDAHSEIYSIQVGYCSAYVWEVKDMLSTPDLSLSQDCYK